MEALILQYVCFVDTKLIARVQTVLSHAFYLLDNKIDYAGH